MTSTLNLHRADDLDVVRDVIDAARAEQAALSLFSPDRAYYLGVETAAEQVLHPDVEAVDRVFWLDRLHPSFIAGYLETVAALTPVWSWDGTGEAAETQSAA